MKPETQQVRKLVEEIQDIENDILELEERKDRLEYQLDKLIIAKDSGSLPALPEENPSVRRGRVESDTSAKKLIANLLNKNPETTYNGETVSQALKINAGTVRTNLSKLVGLKLIEKRSSNTYGAIVPQNQAAPGTEAA